MDDRDLERRLSGYRPVVERAMARRRLAADGGRDRRRWAVTAVAAATVAAGVVGWVALGGDEPASTGSVPTTATPDVTFSHYEMPTDAQTGTFVCRVATADASAPESTLADGESALNSSCDSVSFCVTSDGLLVDPQTFEVIGAMPTVSLAEPDGVDMECTYVFTPVTQPEPTDTMADDVGLPPVWLYGDSVMAGADSFLLDAGYATNVSASHQFSDLADLVPAVAEHRDFEAVVIHLGNSVPIDPDDLDLVMAAFADVPRVVVITLFNSNGPWLNANNDLLRALPAEYPNVIVLDWEVLARQCVDDCFATDEFHLTESGAEFYTSLINNLLDATSPRPAP